ncbi:MAG: type II secretion system F family protein [Planctomycetota bacterium]|nr:type II secretion system F family protein [Planctomycetota bacterium]MDA1248857.1 type II secretion system F family protein [Planctomycetota bacterium]
MSGLLIPVAIFIGVTVLVAAVIFLLSDFGSSSTEDRLEILTGKQAKKSEETGIMKEDFMNSTSGGFSALTGKLFKSFQNMGMFFEQSDSPLRPDQFFMMSSGCVVVGVVLGWASKAPIPLYPVFGIAIGLVPYFWLRFRRNRRFKKFAKQMPDAMELIARALRSGHSLSSGINVVVEEMPTPIATEFMMAYEEQNLGVPIERALKNMMKRMPNMDLKFFVTAVAIQKQAGGDLAEVLDKIGYIVRERFKIMGHVQALTGEGRISGLALQGLPIALFLVVYYMNPDYVMMLFEEELGKQMLFYAIILQILGAFVIKKIVDIKI